LKFSDSHNFNSSTAVETAPAVQRRRQQQAVLMNMLEPTLTDIISKSIFHILVTLHRVP